jgi:hypothetical protein
MQQNGQEPRSNLTGPPPNPRFVEKLNQLVGLANQGQRADSAFFNPPDSWLIERMQILQSLSEDGKNRLLQEAEQVSQDAVEANAAGKAAARAGPNAVVRLDNGGLAFFSQLGVVRRPDLTKYFIDGFRANRDALAFSEENQELFTEVFDYINDYMRQSFASGEIIIQSDRRIGDAIGRSFHARQLLFGSDYLQLPYMWRQLTFGLPENEREDRPDIVEVSIPNWLRDLGMPEELKRRIQESGLTKLVFKAPTKGLSLHLGFDYVGEHKMGPLSIAMFQVKQADGLAVQAALSMARVRTLDGALNHTAVVTVGPSLHGKSTLTIMIELANSELGKLLGLSPDPEEGVYPMNDDIVLIQQLQEDVENTRSGSPVRISYGIDGTENNFYAVPFGLTREDDPITYDVLRGTRESPNPQETLENVVVGTDDGIPDYSQNPVRNMRMVLSRPRLLSRKNAGDLMKTITNGKISDSVHVPMQDTDRVIWQAVMRQNTIMPPLRRLNIEQYVRVLMFGEAVQMGAAIGAIGRPYVEYFSDPFIIGLEDENANLMLRVLRDMANGGLRQEYYAFNTGGVGADSNDEASGRLYKKIPRELTLMLQEALLRGAVKFERDEVLGSDVAVAIVNAQGEKVVDLEEEWLPRKIYGDAEYRKRILVLNQRRYYGQDSRDKAGILRYTKVSGAVFDIDSIPVPLNERELAWLLSFYWGVDQAYDSLDELVRRLDEGRHPDADILVAIQKKYEDGQTQGLNLGQNGRNTLEALGLKDQI